MSLERRRNRALQPVYRSLILCHRGPGLPSATGWPFKLVTGITSLVELVSQISSAAVQVMCFDHGFGVGQAVFLSQFQHQVTSDARQKVAAFWRCDDQSILHHEQVGRRPFDCLVVSYQDRMICLLIMGLLLAEDIGQQGNGFYITTMPADIFYGDSRYAPDCDVRITFTKPGSEGKDRGNDFIRDGMQTLVV